MHRNEVATEQKGFDFPQLRMKLKPTLFVIVFTVLCLVFITFLANEPDKKETLAIISQPQVDDIYFLDFRLLSDKLRPKEKYRLGKVVDITGDIVTLVYGDYFYQRQHAVMNSIRYGQLTYKAYFQSKRHDIPHQTIKSMLSLQAIYLAKRPVRGKLLGHSVGPEKVDVMSSNLIYGKKENIKGEAFLKVQFSETNFETAFDLFQTSSDLGYAKGQVNLAEMYINGYHVEKDLNKALYWLKQASFQSYKPAILKYGIVCKQLQLCNVVDFYQELTASGVNIKFRKVDFQLTDFKLSK